MSLKKLELLNVVYVTKVLWTDTMRCKVLHDYIKSGVLYYHMGNIRLLKINYFTSVSGNITSGKCGTL